MRKRDKTKKEWLHVTEEKSAETSVMGIRGRIEKDFDDKYLITAFQRCVHTEMNCDSSITAAFLLKSPFQIIKKWKKKEKGPVSGAQIISERRSRAPHHVIVHIIWQSESTVMGFFFSLSSSPSFLHLLVTTSQFRMKYGTNYPIMSEKGSELAGAWLKSNLTLISPNPLAGSNRGFKSYFQDITLTPQHTRIPPRAYRKAATIISIRAVMPCQQDVPLHQTNAFVKVKWQRGWIW